MILPKSLNWKAWLFLPVLENIPPLKIVVNSENKNFPLLISLKQKETKQKQKEDNK